MRTSKELQAQIDVLTRIHDSLPSMVLSQLIDDLEGQRRYKITEEVKSYRCAVGYLINLTSLYEHNRIKAMMEIKPDHVVSFKAKKYGKAVDELLKEWLPVEECLEDVPAIELPKGMGTGKLYIQPSGVMECKTSPPLQGLPTSDKRLLDHTQALQEYTKQRKHILQKFGDVHRQAHIISSRPCNIGKRLEVIEQELYLKLEQDLSNLTEEFLQATRLST